MASRLPTLYLPHGGGPWPFVNLGLPAAEVQALSTYLQLLPLSLPTPPKALLVISAHWEERAATVMTAAKPPLYFDYYNFPAESYRLQWPAPGNPALAARVQGLLKGAGFPTASDASRGFDHGTFIPLMLAWPQANVPTLQLSLLQGLDPAAHLAMGRALAPLREEGVLIIGSGMSYHNMRGFRDPRAVAHAEAFDAWLQDTVTSPEPVRASRLQQWASAPSARQVHPREEHLLPLMVVAGAADGDAGSIPYNDTFMGMRLSACHFS